MSNEIAFNIDPREWDDTLERARKELDITGQDAIVERTALEVRTGLIEKTPGRSGGTRGAWEVAGSRGERGVINTSPVMRFLEYGTPENNPGAKIYPKNGKALFIPIVQEGRKTTTVQPVRNPRKRSGKYNAGKNFMFVKWVHGIKPMHIVRDYVPVASERLVENALTALERV